MVKSLLRQLRKLRFSYTPLVDITISKDRLLHNLHTFQKINPSVRIAPVLKSNAYGHGLSLVSSIVDKEDIPFLVVDSYHEALVLRNEGIRSKILMIGYTAIDNILNNKLKNVAFTIVSFDQLEEIAKILNRPTIFHLKIDTGMHRQGILIAKLKEAFILIKNNTNIIIEGICSHLADADGETPDFTRVQTKAWNETVRMIKTELPTLTYFHLSATSGALYSKEIEANVLRLGIGLYGIDPNNTKNSLNLLPVLEMTAPISGTKEIQKGEMIGYNITFEAKEKMRIATLPLGYYEGLDRRLSNKGLVKIGDSYCPIVGRVSMNITTIDITNVPAAKLGTPVTVISSTPTDKNSVHNLARLVDTIDYDLMVHIPQQMRRRII